MTDRDGYVLPVPEPIQVFSSTAEPGQSI